MPRPQKPCLQFRDQRGALRLGQPLAFAGDGLGDRGAQRRRGRRRVGQRLGQQRGLALQQAAFHPPGRILRPGLRRGGCARSPLPQELIVQVDARQDDHLAGW